MFFCNQYNEDMKTTVDGKTDQATPQWIEANVSHLMHPYFRLVMFSKFIIVKFNYFSY